MIKLPVFGVLTGSSHHREGSKHLWSFCQGQTPVCCEQHGSWNLLCLLCILSPLTAFLTAFLRSQSFHERVQDPDVGQNQKEASCGAFGLRDNGGQEPCSGLLVQ